ncbi:MAG: BMP family ABC transporter substrate-binding protein [Selenomonadaceae bacterium]|nr:BMP family ABC transporter substrate-binding protein [Selenomonadaceae bacterium]
MENKKKTLTLYGSICLLLLAVVIGCVKMFDTPAPERPKVGFIMRPLLNSSNWGTTQYNGIKLAADQMGVELLVKQDVPNNRQEIEQAIQDFVDAGCKVIIMTNGPHARLGRKKIEANPKVTFYCSQTDEKLPNLYFYSGRFYEARYLSGMLAAMKSHTGRLGYIAAMPGGEVTRAINAFALGAQTIRQDAVVDVYWTKDWVREDEERMGVKVLSARGADVIAHQMDRSTVNEMANDMGVYSIAYHETPPFASSLVLATIRIQWGEIYQEVLRRSFKKPRHRDVWRGISDGSVSCENFSYSVSSLEAERIQQARIAMRQGRKVFSGEIIDTTGRVRCQRGESLSDETILRSMNWFVKGVITNL